MKRIIVIILLSVQSFAYGQYHVNLNDKVVIGTHTNLETYFFMERLCVQHINNFVFDLKDASYSHQPIVDFAFKRFKPFVNTALVTKTSALLKRLRDSLYDNGPLLNYLVNQKAFPASGPAFAGMMAENNKLDNTKLFAEITDSLRSFYVQAKVSGFLKENAAFYGWAIKEVQKDVDLPAFAGLEKWFGQQFPQYRLYLCPSMPITAGEDSYRGFGARIASPKGLIPVMIMSTDRVLPAQSPLTAYRHFGYDNPVITQMLTKHEMAHTFVNPLLDKYAKEIARDTALFTRALSAVQSPNYINNWQICVIEHLVRLSEIRVAVAMGDIKMADKLRKIHIGEYKCILLPLLEKHIIAYERNRKSYPRFKAYLPELLAYMHTLTPQVVNKQVELYKNYAD